jgi:hypothetical protein
MDRLIPSGLVHKIDSYKRALGSRIIGQDEMPAEASNPAKLSREQIKKVCVDLLRNNVTPYDTLG